MIIFENNLRILNNGRNWKKGTIHVPSRYVEEIGWEKQTCVVLIIKPDEEVTPELIAQKFEDLNNIKKLQKELQEVKDDKISVEKHD